MSETAFEYLLSSVEAVKGVAEATPTKYHLMAGMLMPKAKVSVVKISLISFEAKSCSMTSLSVGSMPA